MERPFVVYQHDPENAYPFPYEGFEYGAKTASLQASESGRAPRKVKPVPNPAPPASPATPAPVTTATAVATAPTTAVVTAPTTAVVTAPTTAVVTTPGTVPTTQTLTWKPAPERQRVSSEYASETGEDVLDDVSSTKVLLDPKRWGVFIHHGPATEVMVNAFVLRSEFQHRYVSLSVSGSKEEQERARELEVEITRSMNMLTRSFALIADPDFVKSNEARALELDLMLRVRRTELSAEAAKMIRRAHEDENLPDYYKVAMDQTVRVAKVRSVLGGRNPGAQTSQSPGGKKGRRGKKPGPKAAPPSSN